MPISAISPDLALRLCPVRYSKIMNTNIKDTAERFLYKKHSEVSLILGLITSLDRAIFLYLLASLQRRTAPDREPFLCLNLCSY